MAISPLVNINTLVRLHHLARLALATLAITQSLAVSAAPIYRCDGRKFCSQMTSCAEATYFLKNCPTVEMDGDNDRVPCEAQWCGR
ncbi:excalibur calcium-binding domain-containing protein [Amphibiibacter pelophylacis]|uniref:Excalibur calcium-binding domain-containing protein n=1 Tax=Amphibiibacter pelophylacis TaxID=1799477 RepID=A0ACC6P4L5_9BURK